MDQTVWFKNLCTYYFLRGFVLRLCPTSLYMKSELYTSKNDKMVLRRPEYSFNHVGIRFSQIYEWRGYAYVEGGYS